MVSWLAAACVAPPPEPPGPPPDPPAHPNVLLVLLDDVGVDKISAYGAHPEPVQTPVIDGLAARGVRFTQAWAEPVCSPTRAALLTGRHPRRTGLGDALDWLEDDFSLSRDEVTIPEVLGLAGYRSAAIGKWHVSTRAAEDPLRDPNLHGFERYAGHLGQIRTWHVPDTVGHSYYRWDRVADGELTLETRYVTTAQIDDALDALSALPEPWFLYLSLTAAHGPLEAPPTALDDAGVAPTDPAPERMATVLRAADRELGRLLDTLPPVMRDRTTVIVMGDNGSYEPTVLPPWDPTRSKITLYEGGVRVPLIVAGPQVEAPGTVSDALVHAVDLLPTLADLAGLDPDALTTDDGAPLALDGVSLRPLLSDPAGPGGHETLFAERFAPVGPPPYETYDYRAIRDRRHKLMVDGNGRFPPQFFELTDGVVDEGPDLYAAGLLTPERQEAFERLSAALEAQLLALPYAGP